MSSINSDEIISILKEEIENFDTLSKDSEVGTVVAVGDGIATIYGIDHAMYGEIVTFETGLKGMVQDIRKNEIGCILFGSDTGIREGTKVARTGKKAGVPVGDAYVGTWETMPSFASSWVLMTLLPSCILLDITANSSSRSTWPDSIYFLKKSDSAR